MMAKPTHAIGALTAAAVVCVALSIPTHASEVATTNVRFQSDVSASTSLRVSSSLLRVAAQPDTASGAVVIGTIEYRAAARTRRDGEVVLTVEAQSDPSALAGGASDGAIAIDFQGVGDGAHGGVLRSDAPQVAGRWVGSGVRTGQLVFTLRGAVGQPGSVPLHFVLSLP